MVIYLAGSFIFSVSEEMSGTERGVLCLDVLPSSMIDVTSEYVTMLGEEDNCLRV
jgi:hypothetical protein